jgi:hypothetical protein
MFWSTLLDLLHRQTDPEPFKLSSFIPMPKQYNFMLWWNTFSNHFNLFHHTTFFLLFKVQKNVSFHDVTSETTCLFQGRQVAILATCWNSVIHSTKCYYAEYFKTAWYWAEYEWLSSECHYAECWYAECHHSVECRGADHTKFMNTIYKPTIFLQKGNVLVQDYKISVL